MSFEWFYKSCPCCGRVVPDTCGLEDLGECQLCQIQRVMLKGPPSTWFETVEVTNSIGKVTRISSRWQVEWENRDPKSYCRHEKQWFMRNKAAKIGGRT